MHDLDERLAALDGFEPSPEFATRIAGRVTQRERNQRTARAAVAVTALVLVVAASVVAVTRADHGRDRQGVVASQPAVTLKWSMLPSPPISNRRDPVAVWTGKEAIFWGGEKVEQ